MSYERLSEVSFRRVDLVLPEVAPIEEIGIDWERLSRLSRLGGFDRDVMVTTCGDIGMSSYTRSDDQDQDQKPQLFLSASRVDDRDMVKTDFDTSGRSSLVHDHPWLNIQVDMPKVVERMRQTDTLLSDPASWSRHLNTAITTGLRRATWEHFLRRPQYGELVANGLGDVIGHVHTPAGFIISSLNNNIIRALVGRIFHYDKPSEICWSLTPGVHPDRAMLVSALSRTKRIVTALGQVQLDK